MTFQDILNCKKMSQITLAKKLNISQPCISKWCANQTTPSIETMQKLADALDVDLITIVNCFTEKDKSEE